MPTDEIETTPVRLLGMLPDSKALRESVDGEYCQSSPRSFAAGDGFPLVSVVIPTRDRPEMVQRAVRSALAQTLADIEIIVVIDGPDAATKEELGRLRDERLRVLQLAGNVGGSEARNIGVRFARGNWIALLDDDDEWYPDKLSRQLALSVGMASQYALVASRFIERTENAERVLPRRLPEPGEIFSDYLFARRGWNSGEGFLQTSTWLVSRALMTRVPFTRGLPRCQDLDWLLHATAMPGVEIRVAPEVLAVFHHDDRRGRVSRSADWRFLYRWAVANRRYFTPRAFSFFLATFCVPGAAKQGEGAAIMFFLLRACISRGRPTAKCLLLFLLCWWMPEEHRRSLRASVAVLREAAARSMSAMARHPLARKAIS